MRLAVLPGSLTTVLMAAQAAPEMPNAGSAGEWFYVARRVNPTPEKPPAATAEVGNPVVAAHVGRGFVDSGVQTAPRSTPAATAEPRSTPAATAEPRSTPAATGMPSTTYRRSA